MLQLRIALFWGSTTLACKSSVLNPVAVISTAHTSSMGQGAFSGLLAYGISFMSGTAGLLGWSWTFVSTFTHVVRWLRLLLMKIIEGIVTVFVGGLAFFGEYLHGVAGFGSQVYGFWTPITSTG